MLEKIRYINRKTKKEEIEKVYGEKALMLLYGTSFLSRIISFFLLPIVSKVPFLSYLYGWLQKQARSKKKIQPFIKKFHIDSSEFANAPSEFDSFNDFFIRKLKPSSRPIVSGEKKAAFFADGRYLFFPDASQVKSFWIKGKNFSFEKLLKNSADAKRFQKGSMVIARLCPSDYHRFHFPFDCIPTKARLINGLLYSVNPWALKKNMGIFCENKRMITHLQSDVFGEVLYIEVGATYVGSIQQTYTPNVLQKKGDEKGYFSFGGSSIILLFEENRIRFDEDLLEASRQGLEIKVHFGESMGCAF